MEIVMAEEQAKGRKVTFKVFRFDPDGSGSPDIREYVLDVPKGTTVLDALIRIKEEQDNTLSFRYSCRMGVCGSCGMFVNGLPMLTCQTQVQELESDVIEIRPLPNYDVLRDCATDFGPLFEKHKSIRPYIIRRDEKELENPTSEYSQHVDNLDWIYQFTYCLKCGLCLAACPTAASDPEFIGPQALTQAYRYMMDVRDEGFDRRMEIVDTSHGCWRCHFATSCSQVCPKGVDPALAIQLLKREIVLRRLRLEAEARGSDTMPRTIEGAERREGIPDAPEKTADKG
jgi:succinate dehydrogenase / fumarate reductase iron-sulfur subunit